MEKFIFIFRGGDTHIQNADSQSEMDYLETWNVWMQGLAEKGILMGGEQLQRTGKQLNGSNKVVSDGPRVEGKEMFNGYLIVNAKDIDEAVEISKGCPIFIEDGSLEVRPIQSR